MANNPMFSLYQVQKTFRYEFWCWSKMSARRRKSTPEPDLAFAYRVLTGKEESLGKNVRHKEPAFV